MANKLDVFRGTDQPSNEFYRDGYRSLNWVVGLQALVILGLTGFLTFLISIQGSRDRYFAETSEGRVMQMVSLDSPNMGRSTLSNWAANAASQILTFGFNDTEERFTQSRLLFTPQGWESFRNILVASKLLDEMIATQQILTSVPESPPVLKREGLVGGVYTWEFEVKMLITFRAAGVKVERLKMVRMVIERQPTELNPSGVGINEWYVY